MIPPRASDGGPPPSDPGQGQLRLATAGSVDDGKSTLIGRLLYDAGLVADDQIAHVEEVSARRGGNGTLDLSLLTDGLRSEREQGITIDVAYRYFQTPRRRFIIADCPGHVQYTRNMVTGASTADLQIVLLDARQGVLEQSRRHAFIASLLRIPDLVVCVNKMDLVDWEQDVFTSIAAEFGDFAARLDFADVRFIPVSALLGDNVVHRSQNLPWYAGPTLLEHLEQVGTAVERNLRETRFPVQWVIRPSDGDGERRYAGQVAGGVLRAGDEVVVLPAGTATRIARIETHDGPVAEAFPPMSVSIVLEDDLDVGRGDLIAFPDDQPAPVRELEASVCWMSERPLVPGARYAIKHTTRTVRAAVESVRHRIDVHTLAPDAAGELGLNDIGRVALRTSAPLMVDEYAHNRATGSFILVDEDTNDTVGAGMVVAAA